MKPGTTQAMQDLITQIRSTFPFDAPAAQLCAGECRGCAIKVLQFLESELDGWESRIAAGERPGLAELSKLIRTGKKVGRVLDRSGLRPSGRPD